MLEIMNMEKVIFARHLNEMDDLKTYGRDAPLIDSVENQKRLIDITNTLYEKIIKSEKKAVLFVTSPRIRAKHTAELVARNLVEKIGPNFKTRFSVNEDLRSTEQGDFILPEGYKAGDVVPFLQSATKIFTQEVHGSDHPGGVDNIGYRFGDPIKLPNGQYKYPELVGHFTRYGESYKDTLERIYSTVLDTSKKYQRFLGRIEVVVVSHGQTYHVFRGLSEIANMVHTKEIEFKKGDSVKLSWEAYKKCSDDKKVPGICQPLDLDYLDDETMLTLLQGEIDFFKQI